MSARQIGFVLLGVACLLLLGSCNALQRAYDLRAKGLEVKGRVIERDLDGGTLTIQWRLYGETYEETFDVDPEFLRTHPQRAPVDLIYLKGSEDEAVLPSGGMGGASSVVLLLLAGLGSAGLGMILVLRVPSPTRTGGPLPSLLAGVPGDPSAADDEPSDDDDRDDDDDEPFDPLLLGRGAPPPG